VLDDLCCNRLMVIQYLHVCTILRIAGREGGAAGQPRRPVLSHADGSSSRISLSLLFCDYHSVYSVPQKKKGKGAKVTLLHSLGDLCFCTRW